MYMYYTVNYNHHTVSWSTTYPILIIEVSYQRSEGAMLSYLLYVAIRLRIVIQFMKWMEAQLPQGVHVL